jgi:DNA (cytosine-5)-methyltransferase 1
MKFYDAFCGIGGFHLGIKQAHPEWECVGACEIDKYARQIYSKHFPEVKIDDDIKKVDRLPEGTEMFCGGFPCQSFSIAGKRGGFNDTRGTLFFEIARLLHVSKPKWVFLENVKGLLSHDNGRTFGTILYTLGELGYWWEYQVCDSKDFGVPQHRERVFIIGHFRGERSKPIFPLGENGEAADGEGHTEGVEQTAQTLRARDYTNWNGNFLQPPEIAGCLTGGGHSGGMHSDMTAICVQRNQRGEVVQKPISGVVHTSMGNNQSPKVMQVNNPTHAGNRVYSSDGLAPAVRARARQDQYASPKVAIPVLTPDRMEKRQNGRRFKENGEPSFTLNTQDRHGIYGGTKIRRLTEVECERLQGYPPGWTEGVSASQRYKCLGNAVTVNVIKAIAERMGD